MKPEVLDRDAIDQLRAELQPDETVEAVVFGRWERRDGRQLVPEDLQGKPLSIDEAAPLMRGWSIEGWGASCAPMHVWTDRRVLFVASYDGTTYLDSVPRHPIDWAPLMCGCS